MIFQAKWDTHSTHFLPFARSLMSTAECPLLAKFTKPGLGFAVPYSHMSYITDHHLGNGLSIALGRGNRRNWEDVRKVARHRTLVYESEGKGSRFMVSYPSTTDIVIIQPSAVDIDRVKDAPHGTLYFSLYFLYSLTDDLKQVAPGPPTVLPKHLRPSGYRQKRTTTLPDPTDRRACIRFHWCPTDSKFRFDDDETLRDSVTAAEVFGILPLKPFVPREFTYMEDIVLVWLTYILGSHKHYVASFAPKFSGRPLLQVRDDIRTIRSAPPPEPAKKRRDARLARGDDSGDSDNDTNTDDSDSEDEGAEPVTFDPRL